MSKKTRPDIDTLLSERARYEAWLDQLAAKAERMPVHVVERVRGDYQERLDKVVEDLRSRADELRAEAVSLEERLAVVAAELESKRDARAEDELRAMVGEYEEAAWAAKAAEHDAGIETLETERIGREGDLARVRDLLAEATRPSRAIRRISETEIPEEPTPVESLAPASDQPASAAESPAVLADAAVQRVSVPTASAPTLEVAAPPPAPPDAPPPPPPPPPPQAARSPQPTPAVPGPAARRPSPFDEIGFLRTVVGRATPYGGTPAQSAAPPESVAAPPPPLAPPPPPPPVEPPPPAAARRSIPSFEPPPIPDVPSAAPARASAPAMPASPFAEHASAMPDDDADADARSPRNSQAARSLKCQECGWMNFPTEWYCEKCGGELAAF